MLSAFGRHGDAGYVWMNEQGPGAMKAQSEGIVRAQRQGLEKGDADEACTRSWLAQEENTGEC